MRRAVLRKIAQDEVALWRGRGVGELLQLNLPHTYNNGRSGKEFVQFELMLDRQEGEIVEFSLAVDDGRLSAFFPVVESFEVPCAKRK